MSFNDDSAIVIVAEYEAGKITRDEAVRRLCEIGYTEQRALDIVAGAEVKRHL